MGQIHVSPSKLESFRKYTVGAYNGWFTEERVIESITNAKTFLPNPEAMKGTAWHRLIEEDHLKYFNTQENCYKVTVKEKYNDGEIVETFIFTPEEVELVEQYKAEYPGFVSEVPFSWETNFKGDKVVFNMRIDAMWGLQCHDHKTSAKPHTMQGHHDSMQWRINLLATEAEVFQYNLYEFRERVRSGSEIIYTPYVIYPYVNMEKDVLMMLDRYIHFCKVRNLMSYVIRDI